MTCFTQNMPVFTENMLHVTQNMPVFTENMLHVTQNMPVFLKKKNDVGLPEQHFFKKE
jgi:hypothetical protein